MADFQGYLFAKVVTDDDGNSTVTPFPNKYIALGSWETTPNSREEIKATRDENTRNLTRVTSAGRKTSIKFKTRPVNLEQKKEIQTFFTSGEVDADQRKLQIKFWNDEDNDYKTDYFYRADLKFVIYKITNDDILYNGLEITLVEY